MPLPRFVARLNKRALNRLTTPIARYAPFLAVVHHTGRRTGTAYAVPVNIFRDSGDIIIPLTYSSSADWVRNVLAAGWCELETKGHRARMGNARLETDREKAWAPAPIKFFLNRLGVHEIVRLTPEA